VLVAIPVSAVDYARRMDAVVLGVDECLDGGELCVGRYVGWGFGRIEETPGGEVALTLRGGRSVILVDWEDRPELPPGLVVSVAGTYRGDGRLSVTRHQLHPHRGLKEVVGVVGLLSWLGGVALFSVRRFREAR
jgi:hypothetical protein